MLSIDLRPAFVGAVRKEKVEAQRLQRRYRKHRDGLFVFLHVLGVPYDNHVLASSRTRGKVSVCATSFRTPGGGFRSDAGAAAHVV